MFPLLRHAEAMGVTIRSQIPFVRQWGLSSNNE
jgi:hypothetical protein